MPVLGIDLGGTKVALCVGREDGGIEARQVSPTTNTGVWKTDLEELVSEARGFWASHSEAASPQIIGLSVPGPIDPEAGLLLNPPNLDGWERVPVVRAFEEAFGCPVAIENDANAAAVAEWRFGAGQGTRDMVYLTMSTGIGGGLILGGRLHRGAFGGAGEIGHVPIAPEGRSCACGLRGCLEAYCGGVAWQARLREETPDTSLVLAQAGGERGSISPEHLVAAARDGDAYANRAFSEWLDDLSIGIAQLIMTLEPRRVVLGTIAIAAGESLCFAPLRERVSRRVWPQQSSRIEIVPAALGSDRAFLAGLAAALEALPIGKPTGNRETGDR